MLDTLLRTNLVVDPIGSELWPKLLKFLCEGTQSIKQTNKDTYTGASLVGELEGL